MPFKIFYWAVFMRIRLVPFYGILAQVYRKSNLADLDQFVTNCHRMK